ncbi:aminoglycoside phosphotransferase family protein [uncultured Sneathiella sp.]|uniref:phosphotransferase family protein n=1 Tax=uncultured Sneathiella sp. TaxID=879315 RepID=UPI002591854A|nr:aminoglycoside phosphotransferase family protein [uncultured Sneathiella sp.]
MLDTETRQFLSRSKLITDESNIRAEKLTGGISSDIWRIDTESRTFVLKQALPELRVSQHWEAPLSRNVNEVNWIREVAGITPNAVPKILYCEPDAKMFIMEFLDCPTWKDQLMRGDVDIYLAAKVGETLGKIHQATANSAMIASKFMVPETFDALRVEPYLRATAKAQPSVSEQLLQLASDTISAKRVLVHGDVSPKNILVEATGPIFLDAECAWYGEPAFDLAFCLNHMLLKCVHMPKKKDALLASFDALHTAYFTKVDWEPVKDLEARTARLLPALFLARIDGKSPVEYIQSEDAKDLVRKTALPFIKTTTNQLSEFKNSWARNLAND